MVSFSHVEFNCCYDFQMRVSQGLTYDTAEAMEMEMEMVDLKGEKSVVTLEV